MPKTDPDHTGGARGLTSLRQRPQFEVGARTPLTARAVVRVIGDDVVEQPGKTVEAFADMQARLQQQLAEQTLLLQVSQRLASGFDLTKTMPHVAQSAQQVAKASAARVVVSDMTGRASFGAGRLAKALADLDDHLLQLSQQIGQVTITNLADRAADPDYAPLAKRLGAVALWPLQVEIQHQGVLWLGYERPHEFTESEQTFLSTLAVQASIAIANARSYQEAKNGRQWLEAVLGSTADPVLVVDHDGRISLINHAAEELLNVDAAAVKGQPVSAVLEAYPRLLRFFENDGDLAEDEEWSSPGGRTFSPRLSRVESNAGEPASYVLVLRDITHFKLLIRNQAEFVRLVSHDLRSPLTYMQGFASMLNMVGELNERQTDFAEKILNGISQMTALVDNIQDAGRWDPETGFYEMSREPTDVTVLVRDIVSNHQAVADKQHVTIKATIAPDIPIVNVDSLMVERALINLVSNAIKYSPDGGEVDVSVTVKDEALVICVRDTGLGIAKEHIPLLFKRGSRVVTPEIKKNRIKGSGLGLFIVRSVARRHSGDAWVESQPGKGSKFYFSFPLSGANLVGSGSR